MFIFKHEIHITIIIGDELRIVNNQNCKYKNMNVEQILMHLKICNQCQKMQIAQQEKIVVKLSLHSEVILQFLIDFIDMQ